MTATTFCTINVLTKSYKIKCPEIEVDNLQLAAAKLHEQLFKNKSATKRLDEYQSLLMAALHISHELVICQNMQAAQREQLAEFINTLEDKIGRDVD